MYARMPHLLVALLIASVAAQPKANKFIQENITVLGDTYDFAMFQLDFQGSDLSYFTTPGYCQSWNGTCTAIQSVGAPNPPNCQCDYTDNSYDFCSPTYTPSQHPCLCPPADSGFCELKTNFGFVKLSPGDSHTYSNLEIIAFYFQAYNTDCDSYVVRFIPDRYEPSGAEYTVPPNFSTSLVVLPNPRVIMICPNDVYWGKTVTFINLPVSAIGNTTVTLETRPMPPPRPIVSICTPPAQFQGTHLCIPSGQEMRFSDYGITSETMIRFLVPVESNCNTLMWISSASLIKLSFTDPWTWVTNSSKGIQTRQAGLEQIPGLYGYCFTDPPLYGYSHYIFGWANVKPTDTIFFDTAGEWVDSTPLSELNAFNYPSQLSGAVTLDCGSKSYTNWKHLPTSVSTMDDGFANVRTVWPQDDPIPFFPALPLSTSWEYGGFTGAFGLNLTSTFSDRLTISVLSTQRLNGAPLSTSPKPLNYEFLTPEELDSCTITLNGIISDSNGPIFITIGNVSTNEIICNVSQYHELSAQVDALIQQANEENSVEAQAAVVYAIDLIVGSVAWSSCEYYIKSLVEINEYRLAIQTPACTAEFNTTQFYSNPCCTTPAGTSEYIASCSVPRDTNVGQLEVTGFLPEFYSVNTNLPQCAEQSVELFLNVLNKLKDPEITCGSTYTDKRIYDKLRSQAFYSCWYPNFGLQAAFAGTPCLHDSECPDGPCVADSKTCALNQTKQTLLFLECLIDNLRDLDSYVLFRTCQDLGVDCTLDSNSTNNQIALNIFHALPMEHGCTMTPWLGFDSNNQANPATLYTPNEGCVGTTCSPVLTAVWAFSLDEVPLKWDCLYSQTPSCALTVDSITCIDSCVTVRCNTMHNSYACNFGPSPCCIADDGYQCLDLFAYPPVNDTTCETAFCIFPNSTVAEIDEATCANTMGCTVDGLNTEEACVASGFCSDATDPIYAIFDPPFDTLPGACLVQIELNSPFILAPILCSPPLRLTALGCLNYNLTQAQCEDPNFNLGYDALLYNSTKLGWIKKATNEAECIAYGKKCVGFPRATQYPSTFVDVLYLPTSALWDTCTYSLEDMYVWTPAKWLPGQPRTAEPTPAIPTGNRSTSSHFSTTPPVFDLRKLFALIQSNAEQHFSLILQSEVLCRVKERKVHLDDLFCTEGSECYTNDNFEAEQLIVACSGDTSQFDAYPLFVQAATDSVSDGTCITIELQTQSITLFQDNAVEQLSTVLLQPTEDQAWAVRNANGAIYGKVLTDGISVEFNSTFTNITFCLPLSTKRPDYLNYTNYPVFDLAASSLHGSIDSRLLTPLNKTIFIVPEQNFICAMNVSLLSNKSYYFIQQMEGNVMAIPNRPWQPNEVAYISVILALYCIGLIVTIYGVTQRFRVSHTFTEVLLIFIILFSFFVFRIVLFAIALGDPDSLTQPAVGYLLVEFPILLFFCFVSLFIITWSIVVRSTHVLSEISGDHWIKLSRFLAILFITIVFTLFILMIILYEELVGPAVLICRSTVLVFDTEEAFILAISYRAVFSTLAFILGICLAIVGSMIVRVMRNKDLAVPISTQIKVISATLFGSFGLFAQAIYYLVITATKGYHQSTFLSLSILLVDEVLPALFFLACIVTLPSPRGFLSSGKKSKSKHTLSKSQGSGTSAGNKSGGPHSI